MILNKFMFNFLLLSSYQLMHVGFDEFIAIESGKIWGWQRLWFMSVSATRKWFCWKRKIWLCFQWIFFLLQMNAHFLVNYIWKWKARCWYYVSLYFSIICVFLFGEQKRLKCIFNHNGGGNPVPESSHKSCFLIQCLAAVRTCKKCTWKQSLSVRNSRLVPNKKWTGLLTLADSNNYLLFCN